MPQIVIEFDTNGQLGLKMSQDVAHNLVLGLGMVEVAKLAMVEQQKQNQNLVQPASGPLPPTPKL